MMITYYEVATLGTCFNLQSWGFDYVIVADKLKIQLRISCLYVYKIQSVPALS